MIWILKVDMNKTFKELEERTHKKLEEKNKCLKESQEKKSVEGNK